jgi:hypothetical protein
MFGGEALTEEAVTGVNPVTSIDSPPAVVGRLSPSLPAASRLLRNRSPALGGSRR